MIYFGLCNYFVRCFYMRGIISNFGIRFAIGILIEKPVVVNNNGFQSLILLINITRATYRHIYEAR